MKAAWLTTSLKEIEGAQTADILLELTGEPDEIEDVRQMTRRAKSWSATVTGKDRDRIVLKMEESE